MDNHPIPQDVTGFQFKLIGSMTVKQFGYVMFGVILAVILYYLPIQSAFGIVLKIFLIPILGVSGFFIAFLPIEGRPVDVMVGNFIKALFMPNQFVYHKTGRLLNFTAATTQKSPPTHKITSSTNSSNKAQQVRQLLHSAHTQKPNKLDERETAFLQSIIAPSQTPAVTPVSAASTPPPALAKAPSTPHENRPLTQAAPSPQVQTQPVAPSAPNQPSQNTLAQQEHLLREQLAEAKRDELLHQATGEATAAHQKTQLLERQVQALHFQRQQLEQQLLHLQNQLAMVNQQPLQQAVAPQQAPQQQAKIPPPPQNAAKKTGLPHVPDTPNVIAGVVKDPRGNVLPNILVEVKDKEGNPVRAFKTNTLGQFASATPLAPGNYTVELEDPKKQNKFDVIQLAATNQILLPIEIISHDAREELRKQLFN